MGHDEDGPLRVCAFPNVSQDGPVGRPDIDLGPRQRLAVHKQRHRLRLRVLPEQARRVFILHDVEGWGHGEIARLTGLAVGTCKSHLHRARALLREVLGS